MQVLIINQYFGVIYMLVFFFKKKNKSYSNDISFTVLGDFMHFKFGYRFNLDIISSTFCDSTFIEENIFQLEFISNNKLQ